MSRFVPLADALAVKCSRSRGGEKQRTRLTSIYALYDASDRCVRYVGKTSMPLYQRLAFHRKNPTNYSMRRWLTERGMWVRIELLEVVRHDEWEAAERGWIAWFRQRGTLLNIDPGGEYRTAGGRIRSVTFGEYQPPVTAKAKATPAPVKRAADPVKAPPPKKVHPPDAGLMFRHAFRKKARSEFHFVPVIPERRKAVEVQVIRRVGERRIIEPAT